MWNLFHLLALHLRDCFRSRKSLEAENTILRHQLGVLRRKSPGRIRLTRFDRLIFAVLYQFSPKSLSALHIVQPETVIRWHRMGFKALWRWKSRPRGGRPKVSKEVRDLIREMSLANHLWGAPRIHGELLLLGIDVSQSTVAKYMVTLRRLPSQGWKTFLRNHTDGVASIDFLVVPTIGFKLLYAFVILGHGRRKLLHIAITYHPSAHWAARQIAEAFPWDEAPVWLIRDNDAIFGVAFKKQLKTMGIRDGPTALRSPWQNAYVERVIGSVRRECLDHIIILNAAHLRRVLKDYAKYYNNVRTHLSLDKNAPVPRPVSTSGVIKSTPHLGGLHHEYTRI
jgi:integrase-like protein